MGRFCGEVGYIATTNEEGSDVYQAVPCERVYYGDITRNARRWENSEYLNDNLVLNNIVSIVADDYAYEHFSEIRYVKMMGGRWKVTNIEIQRPRIILTIGGVYNGPTTDIESTPGNMSGGV